MRLMTACAALVLAMVAMGTNASEIYQWTDASGVTHYSENPPPAGTEYQTRRITDSGASIQAVDPAPAQEAEKTDDPQCATARNNIEVLQGEGPVHQGEGDATRELDADERANQLELAQAAVRAYCND